MAHRRRHGLDPVGAYLGLRSPPLVASATVPVAEPYDLDLLTLAELEQMEVLLRRIEERAALVRADATPAV